MIKRVTTIFSLILLLAGITNAQWENQGAWPDTSARFRGQNHAMAVDPDGKVWFSNYASDTTVINGTDTLRGIRTIKVLNADGTPASFSPILWVTGNGINDTLGYTRLAGPGRPASGSPTIGMREDHNGNILLIVGTRLAGPPADAVNVMYRFNYQTGEAMNKVEINMEDLGHTTGIAPGVDDAGNIFVGPVFGANKIAMYDADFNPLGAAAGADNLDLLTPGFARSMEVSGDGNTIYFPAYSVKQIFIYSRASEFDPFLLTDSIPGPATESITWNEATGDLWFSGGSYNDMPLPDYPQYTPGTWYGYNVTTKTLTDSIHWVFSVPANAAERPRALAFSPDGLTAYLGAFGGAGYPLIQKAVKISSSVRPDNDLTAMDYTLSQNYPNPFNPSTEIKFSVKNAGMVTLKVYDMLGTEVATLVNENLNNGNYTIGFDASKLASGTYIYRLSVNGTQLVKKMMLLK